MSISPPISPSYCPRAVPANAALRGVSVANSEHSSSTSIEQFVVNGNLGLTCEHFGRTLSQVKVDVPVAASTRSRLTTLCPHGHMVFGPRSVQLPDRKHIGCHGITR